MQIDPWVGEEDTSINATNTELLIVIKRKCAYSEHQICNSITPNLVLDLVTQVRLTGMPRETGLCRGQQ